jgi:uncharacterized membrane protein (DUF373 family)
MTSRAEEPRPAHVRLGNRALVLVEDVIYVSIAVLLAVGAALLVVRAGAVLVRGATSDGTDAFIDVLDAILLVFIFVELLYAVRITLKERQIVAEPFLIAGILVCIKEIVVLAVKAPTDYLDKGPSSPGRCRGRAARRARARPGRDDGAAAQEGEGAGGELRHRPGHGGRLRSRAPAPAA